MKRIFAIIFGLLLGSCAFAANLVSVYQNAQDSDPIFKQALAQYQANKELVSQAQATLLPQVDLTGSAGLNKSLRSGIAGADSTSRSLEFGLSLSQSIFNLSDWMAVASANYAEKAALATYNAAAQNLMTRVATAYFNVLEAKEILTYTVAAKQAFHQEYLQAKASFQVGLKTITDVYNAKASYDQATADYVSAKNNLDNAKEDLRTITGKYYPGLASLRQNIPLVLPTPKKIDAWVDVASKQNWNLIAARYTALAAKQTLNEKKAGHLPTLGLTAGYDNTGTRALSGTTTGFGRTQAMSAAVNVSMPIFSGGGISSQVRQAIANYNLANEQREQSTRDTINATRKAFLSVASGIQTVQADKQTIVSNRSSLEGTKEGYKVGTRTMVDVLIAQRSLFNSLQQYARDRHNYVLSLLSLKQAAGTLSEQDLRAINGWLQEKSVVTKKTTIKKTPTKKLVKAKLQTYMQIGAYKNKINATKEKIRVAKTIKENIVIKKIKNLYKVLVGPIDNQKTEWQVNSKLKAAGIKKIITIKLRG